MMIYVRKITVAFCLFNCLSLFGMVGASLADDAEVLPKGVFNVNLSTNFYFPIDERYDPDGDVEDAAADYNATLDSSVFPDLGLVEAGFGMPPGSANIGDSVVSFEYDVTLLNLGLAYGVTDKLTAGINIPFSWVKNSVDARLDATNATVGKNPFFGLPGDPFGVPFIPVALGGVPLVTEDVQQILINNFGYKRFETWSESGIGDMEVGARYQYFKSEDWRLAFTGGVRLPTGDVDDPDNLVDRGFGSGAWALLFRFNNDYTGFEKLVLNGTLRYDLYLPDKEVLRVPEDVNQPITDNKEKVERDLGDVIELEGSAKYDLSKGFGLSALYKFGYGFKDHVSGNRGFAYDSLENETDYTEHVYIVGLSYSTIPLFMEKKFPVPLSASITYRNRFAGSGNVFKSQYLGLALQVFF